LLNAQIYFSELSSFLFFCQKSVSHNHLKASADIKTLRNWRPEIFWHMKGQRKEAFDNAQELQAL